ncbi:nicotinate-nucleotide adenylyltransferase [Halothiobacillus sp. DCM-1]|uniref:nicotinate-nucleotide adenylyltransferase n=1 Tax=Halothiobacillus sp. DCM-1 TaxID=3112558 RepID=UPI0032569224
MAEGAPLLGILGGTFDPVHFGHLRLAEESFAALALERLCFVPSANPPHRPAPVLAAATRFALVQAAIADRPGFFADDREIRRAGTSYTVETLQAMTADYPDHHRVLILGMDAFNGLTRWHRWQELFHYAHLAVATRPGAQAVGEAAALLAERSMTADELKTRPAGGIVPLSITRLDISATAIRAARAAGRSIRYLVPEGVRLQLETSQELVE